MENIQDKFTDVYEWNGKHKFELLAYRKHQPDIEWLILGYLVRMLKRNGLPFPTYAVKGETPDFMTYNENMKLFAPIEVTEVIHPERKRMDEYKQALKDDEKFNKLSEEEQKKIHDSVEWEIQQPDLKGKWHVLFHEIFKKKFADRNPPYPPDTWLVIYYGITTGHTSHHGGFWYLGMESLYEEFFQSDKEEYKDIKFGPFKHIFVIKEDGDELVQIYPGIEKIQICQYERGNMLNWEKENVQN